MMSRMSVWVLDTVPADEGPFDVGVT